MGGAVGCQQDGQAGHAFTADNADFDIVMGAGADHHRGEAGVDEVNVLDGAIAQFELAAYRQFHGFEVGLQQREIVRRETRKNPVACH